MHTAGIIRQNSTLTASGMDDAVKKLQRSPVAKKKVQFSAKHILTCRKLTADEKVHTWWSPAEFQAVRMAAKLVTRDLRKNSQHAISDIDETYTTALHLSCALDDEAYDTFLDDPSEFSGCLQGWCHTSCWGRGLEKYTSTKHRYERTEFAKEARAAVIRLHRNPDLHANEIAAFYKDYSRASCIYARLVGAADAECIQEPQLMQDPILELSPLPTIMQESEFEHSSPVSSLASLDLMGNTKERPTLLNRMDSRSQLLVRQLSERIENAV